MPKPIPGKQYTVEDENSLSQIAARAYGDEKLWPRIWSANQFILRSGDPDLIFPGEVISIPVLPERQKLKTAVSDPVIPGKDKDDMTIVIDGLEIKSMNSRVVRTMDTAADAWSASLAWQPGVNPDIDKRVKPYAYPPASVYIGGKLMVNGILYTTESDLSGSQSIKRLEGASFTADLVDSTLKPPYEKNNVTLKQRIEEIVKPLGIDVVFDIDEGGAFDRVTADENDTIFQHLAGLAMQRSALISSTVNGDLLVTRAASGRPVATLEEGSQGSISLTARYDGRKRFNVYRAIGDSPSGNKVGLAKDNVVPRSRFLTFQANETISGDIDKAAQWRRSKQLADALTIPFPTDSWYRPDGKLWRENTIVTVISPTIHVPDGFNFLIRSVEYIDDVSGKPAILNLVPPQVYTGEELKEPWS